MKFFIWRIRYAIEVMRILKCSPRLAWYMSDAGDEREFFENGDTPKDTLQKEISYWDWE